MHHCAVSLDKCMQAATVPVPAARWLPFCMTAAWLSQTGHMQVCGLMTETELICSKRIYPH